MDEAFEAFLREKRIHPKKWAEGLPEAERAIHLEAFRVLGRKAYEQRYLFYFNAWRKLYPLSEELSA
ncbi:MAG: hypothetical protein KatS3mg026_0683 [Bacteroidia bacterium]|nr:MAG: hypothetical protein KatS3mg026_0683 [Bacteroidia bacterium]